MFPELPYTCLILIFSLCPLPSVLPLGKTERREIAEGSDHCFLQTDQDTGCWKSGEGEERHDLAMQSDIIIHYKEPFPPDRTGNTTYTTSQLLNLLYLGLYAIMALLNASDNPFTKIMC